MSYRVINSMKTGTYESQYGEDDGSGKKVMVKYTVQFDGSDDAIEVSQKPSTTAPKPGDEMEGTIETTQYGKRFKKAQNNTGGFNRSADPATRTSIENQTSLNAAVTAVNDYYSLIGIEKEVKLSEYAAKIVQVSKAFASSIAGKNIMVEEVKEAFPGAEEVKEPNADTDQINLDDIPL